jgi:LysM repeat protein
MLKYSSWALLLVSFTLTSCNSHLAVLQQDKHESSIALNEVRAEISDLRHELNNARVEIQILEEQIQEQENQSKKPATPSLTDSKLPQIERRLILVEQMQEKIQGDFKQISSHANQTKTCLQQYSKKIAELEVNQEHQSRLIRDVGDLKTSLKSFTTSLASERTTTYRVKAGDSLERIARNQKTSIEALKKANNLSHDKIMIGQELVIP